MHCKVPACVVMCGGAVCARAHGCVREECVHFGVCLCPKEVPSCFRTCLCNRGQCAFYGGMSVRGVK